MLSFVNVHVCLIKECLRTQPACKLLNEMESWRNGHNTNIILNKLTHLIAETNWFVYVLKILVQCILSRVHLIGNKN